MKPKLANAIHLGTGPHGARFTVPLDLATESIAIIARKGAGKTYTAKVIAEDLLANHIQTVVIDPLDVWWGLRLSADGKREGQNVVIFGGSHADLPLTEHLGKTLADLIVDRGISAVLVLDHLSMAAQRRFMAVFCEHLYDRKSAQEHRTPLHLVIDEADSFAPQQPPPDAMACLGAVDRLVRRGRSRGLGATVVTQRPAVLSKNVLTQTEVLITLQVVSPQDRAALTEWIKANADAAQAKEFLDSLSGLERGEAWIWSPVRLKLLTCIRVRTARTYDSSYTPRIGEKQRKPPHLRPIDLDKLRGQLEAVVEEAKANDPKALKARVRELEAKLAAAPAGVSKEQLAVAFDAGARDAEKGYARKRLAWVGQLQAMKRLVNDLSLSIEPLPLAAAPPVVEKREVVTRTWVEPRAPSAKQMREAAGGDVEKLAKAHRTILTVLAQHPSGCTKTQTAILAGYSHRGGGFLNPLSRLNVLEYIEKQGDRILITDEGKAALGPFEPLPTGKALIEHWYRQLDKAGRSILKALVDVYPTALTKENLAAAAGYEPNGGGFLNPLSKLRTLQLAEGYSEIKAADHLMEGT